MNVKRGDIVAWWQEPHVPLKVISDPFPFNGGVKPSRRNASQGKRLIGSRGFIA